MPRFSSTRVCAVFLVALGVAGYPLRPLAAQQATPSTDSLVTARLRPILTRPEFTHALFGVEFFSLDEQRPVYAMNADKLFIAASTTKLLTTGTALRLLGADHRFRTRIYRTGAVDTRGTLNGDVVLVPSGDLNLSGRIQPGDTLGFTNEDHSYGADSSTRAVPGDPLLVIRELAGQVAARGVKRITGRVVVDISLFPEGDRELGTGVVLSPVVVNDNLVDVVIGPGGSAGATTAMDVSPRTSYVRFINTAVTGAPGSRARISWSSDVVEPDGSHTVTIGGSFPAGQPAILYSYAVPEPSRFAQVALTEALRERQVAVALPAPPAKGDVGARPAAYTADNVIAEHVSPPFAEEAKVTLKVSQNLHASSLPFIVKATLARDDTATTGFDLERRFLEQAGLDLTGAQQSDGAGGNARYSPDFMARFLAYMARQPDFTSFERALPILGRDGTLWNIQRGSPAAGKVRAKTGTLAAYDALNRKMLVTAKGLGGYFTTPSGRRYAFAAYVNNVAVPLERDAVARIAGQAMGEIAAVGYTTLP